MSEADIYATGLEIKLEEAQARIAQLNEYVRKLEKRQISKGSHGRINYGGQWYVPEGYPEDE